MLVVAAALACFAAPAAARNAYVPIQSANRVSVLETTPGATNYNNVFTSILLGGAPEPYGIAIKPSGGGFFHFYITDPAADRVWPKTANSSGATNGYFDPPVTVGDRPSAIAFKPDDYRRAYVTNRGSDTVSVVNVDGTSGSFDTVVASPTVGDEPTAVAVTPDGSKAYVANSGTDNVSVIDTATNTVVATVPVGDNPNGVAIAPDTDGGGPITARAYVANTNAGTVSVIDTVSDTVTATVSAGLGLEPTGVATSPDGNWAVITNRGSDTIAAIDSSPGDPLYNTVVAINVPVGDQPVAVALSNDSTKVYVANQGSNDTTVLTVGGGAPPVTVTVGQMPSAVAVAPGGSFAVVANQSTSNATVISTVSDSVTGTFPISGPTQSAITPDGRRVYVTSDFSRKVSVIDVATNSLVTTVTVGDRPQGVAITPDGRYAYVANTSSNDVSVIDTATNTVTATVAAGKYPVSVAITPNGSKAYVVNRGSPPSVTVIQVSTNTPVASIPVGSVPQDVAITPDGRYAFVANVGAFTTQKIDTSTDAVVGAPAVGGGGLDIAITPDGTRAYVAQLGASKVVDTETNAVSPSIPGLTFPPLSLAITPDGKRAYYPATTNTTASVVDTDPTSPTYNTVTAVTGSLGASIGHGLAIVPNQPPVAELSATPGFAASAADSGATPTQLDATSSHDPDGTVARYDWDFGDGTTLADGGATPQHTYERTGTYTVTVTETDNEGCSLDFVFTGQTASCNGSGVARKSIQVTVKLGTPSEPAVTPDSCFDSLLAPLPSLGKWSALGGTGFRVKGFAGGYLLRSSKSYNFSLQVRRVGRRAAAKPKRVDLYLDGALATSDRRAPYSLAIDPKTLEMGRHTATATYYAKRAKKRAKPLVFQVSNCEAAAFSASMVGKRKKGLTDLDLRARSGGAELKTVKFDISKKLRISTGRLKGKTIGTLKLTTDGGARKVQALRVSRSSKSKVTFAAGDSLTAGLQLRGKRQLTVDGLQGQSVTGVQLILRGKKTRLLRNPASCKTHSFAATLTSTAGKSLALKRSLKMCKGSRR